MIKINPDEHHICLDLETLDLAPTAQIIQIAVAPVRPGVKFSILVSPYNNRTDGSVHYTSSEATIKFWEGLTRDAVNGVTPYTEAYRCGYSIDSALHQLRIYVEKYCSRYNISAKDIHWWTRHKEFDIPVLRHAFVSEGVYDPIHYKNIHCTHDLSYLDSDCMTIQKELTATFSSPYMKHDARHDAEFEACFLRELIKAQYNIHTV